jgi:hypothetical protein
MPLCFWASQTAVVASDVGVGIGRLAFRPSLPPHTAATAIQRACRSHVIDRMFDNGESDDNATPLVVLAELKTDNLNEQFESIQRAFELFAFLKRKRIGAFLQRKRIGHKLAEDSGSCHLVKG